METVDMFVVRSCYMAKRPGAEPEYIAAVNEAPVLVKVPKYIKKKVKTKDGNIEEQEVLHPEYPHLKYVVKPEVDHSIPRPAENHPDIMGNQEASDDDDPSTPPRRRRKRKIG